MKILAIFLILLTISSFVLSNAILNEGKQLILQTAAVFKIFIK